jgi:hypothetical protein
VRRGFRGTSSVNQSKYMIVIEFEKNKNADESDSESFYSSSDEELER